VVQAFDNCGGVGKANVTITTTGEAQLGGFLYTVNTNAYNYTVNTVYGFTIVPSNGALAPTGQGFVNTNIDPMSVASDAGGYRLYVGDYMSGMYLDILSIARMDISSRFRERPFRSTIL
jgi:hypothetical protein